MKRMLISTLVLLGAATMMIFALDDIALPPGGDFYGSGGDMTTAGALTTQGNLTVAGTITSSGALAVTGAITATGAIDGVPTDTSAGVTSVSTDVDTYGQVVKKTITLTNATVTLEDSKADGNGLKILDVQEGAFTLLGALADLSVVSNDAFNASTNDIFYSSLGTAAAADADADLTSTEADIIPKTTIDTTGSTVLTNDFHAVLASPAIFDGTGTAKDIFVNCAVADASTTGPVTNKVSGTVILYLMKQGDY